MMGNFIDKLAWIFINNRKILVTLSKGKDKWYIPGGKREKGESDEVALIREIKEELSVDLIPKTIAFYGVFEAQAHEKPEGIIVGMTCYRASFNGKLNPSQEIGKMDFFTHRQKVLTSQVDHLIFDDLRIKGIIK
jgi:8-oxo-dGTP pyrophosphatase MutT (NUDIX family)